MLAAPREVKEYVPRSGRNRRRVDCAGVGIRRAPRVTAKRRIDVMRKSAAGGRSKIDIRGLRLSGSSAGSERERLRAGGRRRRNIVNETLASSRTPRPWIPRNRGLY